MNTDGMQIIVKAKPHAKKTRVIRWLDENTVEIALHAPPVDGKANAELVNFLSDQLNVRKGKITIVSGLSSKLKRVEIPTDASTTNLQPDQPSLL